MKKIIVISNNSIGSGLSGGDRIFIELIKGWRSLANITLIGSEEAKSMASARGAQDVPVIVSDSRNESPNAYTIGGLFHHYLRRLRKGCKILRQNRDLIEAADIIYSASDAYPDFIPALLTKLREKTITWIAGYYLFVPHPFSSNTPYKGKNWLRGCLYWFMQIPSYYLVKRFADYVFVTSEPDVQRFVTHFRPASKIVVVQGGVDTGPSEQYLRSGQTIPVEKRKYDACFVGRLHYQKGVLELVEIWKHVVAKTPTARLAMIGDGPLECDLKDKITAAGLDHNIELLGFLDGDKKYSVFKQSKLIIHPATYDSGGMAAAEGMAWCLPAVSFDLEALKTYYPKGMVKTKEGDLQEFADNIQRLLDDRLFYERMAEEAHGLIIGKWDWNKRTQQIYYSVINSESKSA
ncbi:MAG: glycosyltransferase family 4 protein [Kiritimatiellae bacterium]|nr:glycosyltransferase family 4 protein [Kiritimatiellia bacterium]MDD5521314.1 glycosyltransferase family 4 protein [Kiritimatiellia bacterium]